MSDSKFQIFRNPVNGEYFYRLCARNGEIILSGEGYPTKQSCYTGIDSVKVYARNDFRYEKRDDLRNYAFRLKSPSGETIGRSECYPSTAARETGMAAVKADATLAGLEDLA